MLETKMIDENKDNGNENMCSNSNSTGKIVAVY